MVRLCNCPLQILVFKPCTRIMMSRMSPFVQGIEHPPVLLVDGYNVLHMYVQHMQETQPKSRMATHKSLRS